MKPKHLLLMVAVPFFVVVAEARAVNPRYVATCGNDSNSGANSTCGGSSSGPKLTIQNALTASASGETVIVLPGTYSGSGNRDLVFPLTSGVTRDVIVECQHARECIIDCGGAAPTTYHRAFVFDGGSASNNVIIDGFVIENGFGASIRNGGAIFIARAMPTIRNCTFQDNEAPDGGAIYLEGDDGANNWTSIIESCVITSNTASTGSGGGILFTKHAHADIKNCQITYNSADDDGGGIAWDLGSDILVIDTVINDNQAGRDGGGIRATSKVSPLRPTWIKRSTIARNKLTGSGVGGGIKINDTGQYGGGLCMFMVNTSITGNTVSSTSNGGGIYIAGLSTPIANEIGLSVVNSILVGNTAAQGAGIFIDADVPVKIQDSTLTANEANAGGAAIRWASIVEHANLQRVKVHNSIVYDNSPAELSESASNKLDVQNSDVKGTWSGTGNVNSNPGFITTPSRVLKNSFRDQPRHHEAAGASSIGRSRLRIRRFVMMRFVPKVLF